MVTVTIPKNEYNKLIEVKFRYERLRQAMEEDVLSPSPFKKRSEVLKAFKKTGLYTDAFLESLKRGLKRSSYFQA